MSSVEADQIQSIVFIELIALLLLVTQFQKA